MGRCRSQVVMTTRGSILLVAVALSGCQDRREPVPEPTPDATAAQIPDARPSAPSAVPDRVTVSTNEPFFTAAVDGDTMTLTGVTTPRRVLRVFQQAVTSDSRRWLARDGRGAVIVTVTRSPCSDDMSGAPRDFVGTLVIDGRTMRGCAYAGKPPPPPPAEDAGVIPPRFVGNWNVDAAACARPAASIDGVRVTPGALLFHESAGTVKNVESLGPYHIRITADYDGEGERWTTTQTLRITGNRLTIDTEGQRFSRVRCPE